MKPVERKDLLDLETYEKTRPEILRHVLEVKERRRVHLGDELTFLFENTETIRYQILEMLRAEQKQDWIPNESEIRHEIETYNELLGGKGQLGCALLIEVEDPAERDRKLRHWINLPRHLFVRTASGRKVRARYDQRQVGRDRLSSVQYLKFDLDGEEPVGLGSDLLALPLEVALSPDQRTALREDLASDR